MFITSLILELCQSIIKLLIYHTFDDALDDCGFILLRNKGINHDVYF